MYYLDERFIQQCYQERLKEAEHERLAHAILRARRQAAKSVQPASPLSRLGRLFRGRPATAQA